MATRAFARRPRVAPPALPDGEFVIEPPPELPRTAPTSIMTYVLPVAMIAMVGGFIVVGGLNSASLMMGGMMLVMTIGMVGTTRGGGPAKAQLATDRNDYLSYLASLRAEIQQVREAQREALAFTHPTPSALWSLAGGRRMWERRHHDEDFTEVRVATGPLELASPLRPPQSGPINEVDPICAVALSQLVRAHSTVEGLPIAIQLQAFPVVEFGGDRETARALARAAVCQLATFHGPDALRVAAVVDPAGRAQWDWLKWLPHTQHPTVADSLGPLRMLVGSLEEADALLADDLATRGRFSRDTAIDPDQPQILLIVDGGRVDSYDGPLTSSGLVGVTVLDISQTSGGLADRAGLRLVASAGRLGVRSGDDVDWIGAPDGVGLLEADALARRLAPYRLAETRRDDDGLVRSSELPDMLGLSDVTRLDPAEVWKPRALRDLLRVPIGVGPTGEAVELDIKESALGGMGPHGLVVGATGSGKSELLRTLVLALAVTHGPEQLNLVLIDFKGGATFAGLQDLPHTAAVITNLQDDLAMVDRMHDALSGEMNRRQEMLRAAGNLLNVGDYAKARQAGAPLEPLPWLFVVCDEFSELLTQKPDFAELFVAIGRLGRSLGIHLLLASQRLDEGRLRGLDSHLSYRIGLKTFSALESRAVLGVPDAYELPPQPGSGFLKFETSSMTRFKAAYVSGPLATTDAPTAAPRRLTYTRPVSFVSSRVDLAADATRLVVPNHAVPNRDVAGGGGNAGGRNDAVTLLDLVVRQLRGHGTPAHEVWLPPLADSPTLDAILPPLRQTADRGLTATGWSHPLRVPVGVVDLPYEQRRDPFVLDFSGAAGNGVVVGGPRSGKSLTLRTIITALALTHTPREVQAYVVDLGGGALGPARALPHVGGVATRADRDYLRRLVAEVAGVLAEREARFRELGVESMADYRARQRRGDPRATSDPFGDVFLVIDGWGAFREEFEDLESRVTSLAARGLSYGVHVVIGAARWQEVRPALKDSLGTRVELRLGDPFESEIDRRAAQGVPAGAPGRGLTPGQRHLLVALARADGSSDAGTVPQAFADLANAVKAAWPGPQAPAVRTLPDRLDLAELPLPEGSRAIPIGINEDALAPVNLDFDADPHLLYFADGEMGKTTFLKVLATGIMRRYTSEQARILMVDYRRTMLGFVPPEYLAGYAPGASGLAAYLGDLIPLLNSRLPGTDITPEQLRSRSWWAGPEAFILVDDYDLVATGDNPLLHLRELLPQARDVGLHLVLARRAAGASRALYDPMIQSIRDLGSPGFVGTGATDEGPLLGQARPRPAYPPGRGMLVSRRSGEQLVQLAAVP
jgi:S-DNA-T family DNA segregation ATPase FtsK/SpoIIIE